MNQARTSRPVLLLLASAIVCFATAAAAEVAEDAPVRNAVVRLEAAVDPLSLGPDLAAELAARQPWTPYEVEIARRLRVGSTGTGFFVNSRGDLVTNAHVLLSGVRYRGLRFSHAEWDSMAVLLNAIRDIWVTVGAGEKERTYLATPVAVAEDLDLAVLRVHLPPNQKPGFDFLPLAASGRLRVGDPVTALGFPDEEFQRTEGGILSLIRGTQVHDDMQLVRSVVPETGREIVTVSGTGVGPVVRFQHSAPTGHGSSGGPLVDSAGRVVGVAYALLAARRPDGPEISAYADLNLAIVSSIVVRFLREHAIPFTEVGP
jgi:S1-C subfamily serine protease